MSANEKTKAHLRLDVPVDSLEPQDLNPNEMSEEQFNLLYDNIERMGVTDPILVRHKRPEEITPARPALYKIVGGFHRWEVAKLHGMDEVPVTVITDPDFDEDMEKFQIVRHNIIKGKMNPQKFLKLYESLSNKYTDTAAAEMFGFAEQEEFRRLVHATALALPTELKDQFKEASKELKTIDDLTLLLHRLFSSYGDTLPFGFMIFDFGGHDHVWVRMLAKQKQHLKHLAEYCREQGRSLDVVLASLMQLAATKDENVQAALLSLVQAHPAVEIPADLQFPTLEAIQSASAPEAGDLL